MAKQIKYFGPDPKDLTVEDMKATGALIREYNSDAALQQKHGTVYAYLGANGVDVPAHLMDPPAARPNVEGYIASIKGNHFNAALTEAEKEKVETYASTWQVHADIRKEFRTFPAYASYMRATDRGLVKHYGKRQ